MSFTQSELDDLAKRYTEAWNSKVPENVAAFHAPTSGIVINRGEPSAGHEGLTAMAAGFHADVPDLHLSCDGIRGAGTHVVYMWTFTGHHAQTGNSLHVKGWEEWELNDEMKVTSSLGWFDGEEYDRQVSG
ncbi:SnoaL-like domain-containing protein [Roseivivax lentus]|uniref:SnoaL-like domain-containing protein n=1 Tax=Roseivivax lentus TaxID=633194 RepID=A0A1N7N351_9RHOB|nr:nuclear transport factor 2 family protein [Roseivivax lentus]SIS92611.1 SnoaL-like domain-containing protein [Roseivivax lentus]